MPVFKIHHITQYQYSWPVRESVNEIKIYPYQSYDQEVLQHDLVITSSPEIDTYTDYWGNKTGVFNCLIPHQQLMIDSRLMVRTLGSADIDINFTSTLDDVKQEIDNQLHLVELTKTDHISSRHLIDQIILQVHADNKSIAEIVYDCCGYIYSNFKYIKGITSIESTVDEILEQKAGVCQDFAHVMLHVLRTLGIPSRYVSGYICPNKKGMRGEGATHAWVEALIPQQGWQGIDPTNMVWVTNNHVKLAVGRNFTDCTPMKGTFKGPARQELFVTVSVSYEDGGMFEDINSVPVQAQLSRAELEAIDRQVQQQ